MAGSHIVSWRKAKLSPAREKPAPEPKPEALPAEMIEAVAPREKITTPSLFQRFRTRLKWARLH